MNFGRDIEYQIENYKFKNFIHLNNKEISLIWSWRNDSRIANWMSNQAVIPLEKHTKFVKDLKNQTNKLYWLVFKDDTPVGVLDIVNIDLEKMVGFLGYYLSPNLIDSGDGLEFNYYCRFFLFNTLNFNKLTGEIMVENTKPFLISSFFNVKVEGITSKNGMKYLKMIGNKNDFNKVSPQNLIRQFIKFIKQNPVNWNAILANLE